MPELPEVETLVRQLQRSLPGLGIVSARLSHDNLLSGVSRSTMLRQIVGSSITAVTRRAKHALIHTDSRILAVQPGMTGNLLYLDHQPDQEELRYGVLVAGLSNGGTLIYRDVRRIGTLRWLTPAAWEQYASRLGPEPLDPHFSATDFVTRVGGSRSAIKKVIMNQRVLVGVGNIYAVEALFAAGIDPSRAANTVPAQQLASLHQEIRRILRAAIRREGTSFRDYRTSTGERGGFQQHLLVYGREGQPCRNCGTTLVSTHEIDGRATVFCWRCQK